MLTEEGYTTLSSYSMMKRTLILGNNRSFRCTEVSVDSPFLRMKVLGDADSLFDVYIPTHFVDYVASVAPGQDPIGFSDRSQRPKK